ncbi:hypothetical protein KXR53_32270 [Inquilinus limosus]|uniref:hypothetical protein n=1 Tax=Inquilinus limosus TaxID=171674 RepID=UPI003F17984C
MVEVAGAKLCVRMAEVWQAATPPPSSDWWVVDDILGVAALDAALGDAEGNEGVEQSGGIHK